MFCKNCGEEIKENSNFCLNCGASLSENIIPTKSAEKESIIFECKGSLQGGGVGKIVLTNKSIMWTKSKAANFLAGGVFSLLTKGDTAVKIEEILKADKFMSFGGGGLQVYTNSGKNYKFAFNSAKDRDKALEYISEKIK